MTKTVLKYWAINFFTSIVLFVIYQYIISNIETVNDNWIDFILNILDIFLNFHFAIIGFFVMIINSFCILLNLNVVVRQKFWLSFLSFLGIPILYSGYLFYIFLSVMQEDFESFFTKIVCVSIAYLLITIIEFIFFQKTLKNLNKTTNCN